jgi:hypothetical protein
MRAIASFIKRLPVTVFGFCAAANPMRHHPSDASRAAGIMLTAILSVLLTATCALYLIWK